jgi:hypothetical protein
MFPFNTCFHVSPLPVQNERQMQKHGHSLDDTDLNKLYVSLVEMATKISWLPILKYFRIGAILRG